MLNNSGLITLTIRRSFMYGTPRAYKKAANDQEGERRGTSAMATVNEKSSLFFDLSSKKHGGRPVPQNSKLLDKGTITTRVTRV